MQPDRLKERFEALMAASGTSLESLTPERGLDLMCRFFGDAPENGILTCSWGVATRYGNTEYGFIITRGNFDPEDEDRPYTSLSLIFKVGPPEVAGDFPGLMEHCGAPEHLATFRSAVEQSPPYLAWGRSQAAGVALVESDPESWLMPLVDWWGVRDPARPILHMTEEQWLRSDDVSLMLRWFHQQWPGEESEFDRFLRRYGLACCRRIWRLLPLEEIRSAIELAERKLDGRADPDAYARALYLAEVAHERFNPDPEVAASWTDQNPETLARWFDDVARIPPRELAELLNPSHPGADLSPRDILAHAAYFAYMAMCYHVDSFGESGFFHSAPLLREIVGNPFRTGEEPPQRAGEGDRES